MLGDHSPPLEEDCFCVVDVILVVLDVDTLLVHTVILVDGAVVGMDVVGVTSLRSKIDLVLHFTWQVVKNSNRFYN